MRRILVLSLAMSLGHLALLRHRAQAEESAPGFPAAEAPRASSDVAPPLAPYDPSPSAGVAVPPSSNPAPSPDAPTPPSPYPPSPYPSTSSSAAPNAEAAASQSKVQSGSKRTMLANKPIELTDEKIQHIIKALDHLRSAGFTKDARNVEVRAMRYLITVKKRELDDLEREIRRIDGGYANRQIMAHISIVEIDRAKFAKTKGIALAADRLASEELLANSAQISPGPNRLAVLERNSATLAGVKGWIAGGIAKLIAEPTVVCVSGRPAMFQVGGEVPVPVKESGGKTIIEFRKFGTQVDLMSLLLSDEKVRMEIRVGVSHIDGSTATKVDGWEVPLIKSREVDFGVELNLGQTAMVSGLVQTRDLTKRERKTNSVKPVVYTEPQSATTQRDTELLVLVRPELTEPLESGH